MLVFACQWGTIKSVNVDQDGCTSVIIENNNLESDQH